MEALSVEQQKGFDALVDYFGECNTLLEMRLEADMLKRYASIGMEGTDSLKAPIDLPKLFANKTREQLMEKPTLAQRQAMARAVLNLSTPERPLHERIYRDRTHANSY